MEKEKKVIDLDLYDPNAIKPFIITVSSRALFDLEESHEIFETKGEKEFEKYQLENENKPLKLGPAYPLIKKIIDVNKILPEGARPFEVILLSRNSPETGLRVFNTIEKLDLDIYRAVFTSGESPSRYLDAIGVDLMLSSNPVEVKRALDRGVAAAALIPHAIDEKEPDPQIRIAFDGDAVLFGDDSERRHSTHGFDGFREHEIANANNPMGEGPLKGFLDVIHALQEYFPNKKECPVRTALVTARSMPTHKRAILTLRHWGVRVDVGMFLGGKDKGPFLEAFNADLFLDDSMKNIENAVKARVPSGHVPYGIRNEENADESNFTGGGQTPESVKKEAVQQSKPRAKMG